MLKAIFFYTLNLVQQVESNNRQLRMISYLGSVEII